MEGGVHVKKALCFLLLMAIFPECALSETADIPIVYMTTQITTEWMIA